MDGRVNGFRMARVGCAVDEEVRGGLLGRF